MLLYIIRHAWAELRDDQRWPDDSQRPLTKEGRKRFVKLLKRLEQAEFAPTIVATSPLVRGAQTAELVAERMADEPTMVQLEALAPGSDLAALVKWTSEQNADEIAWVGHSPDVEGLAASLIGHGDAAIRFAKGAVAAIRFDEPVAPGAGELLWLATAKLLGV